MNTCVGGWLVQVKHGKGWREYPGEVIAATNLAAARYVRWQWGKYSIVRVRDAGNVFPWHRFTFIDRLATPRKVA